MPKPSLPLLAILVLAAVLRLVRLPSCPPGPNPDEASNAVDARCLGLTACDRYGAFLPFYLKAYDDYREAAFTYLAAPLVLSLHDALVAVRLVAVCVGVGTVWLVYRLGRAMFSAPVGQWAALWVALNPQHIFWSRLGMEVILVPLAGTVALLAYLHCAGQPRWGATRLALALLLVLYSGMMGKALAVLLVALFLVSPAPWLASARSRPAHFFLAAVLLALGSVPAVAAAFAGPGHARFDVIRLHGSGPADLVGQAVRHYFTYWSPTYLIVPSGAGGLTFLPHSGMVGCAELLCLLSGVLFLLIGRPAHWRLLMLFLLLYPVPAAVTQSIAPSRVLIGVPALQLVAGYGAARLASGARRLVLGSTILLGAGLSAVPVIADLWLPAPTPLDQHFCGPEYRAIRDALALATSNDLVVIDAVLPFAPTYAIYIARPAVRDFQGNMDVHLDRGVRLVLGHVWVAYPSAVPRPRENGRTLLVSGDTPGLRGARRLARYGSIPFYGGISLYEVGQAAGGAGDHRDLPRGTMGP
jgi:4-amino-4-deoxy-L-arabinose transferase-like glycosyltransferase